MSDLIEAKRKLYSLLLKKSVNSLTEIEVNIMFELAHDRDIQDIIDKKFYEEKT